MKLSIKNRFTDCIIFEYEKENNTIKETVNKAIEAGADLREADLREADLREADLYGADLSGADLREANLREADLYGADLYGADLYGADLREANLREADLREANLREANLREANLYGANLYGADLSVIKNDMFIVLLHAIPEIKFLKQAIVSGNIDGSTYVGECACLSGTVFNGATKTNSHQEKLIKNNIISCRNSTRPIERFFLAIKPGDTPENSHFSKLALEWIEEFEQLLNIKSV